jgi:hypothetical protein
MGYEVLAHVHAHSQARGLDRALHYELAGFADSETWECYPSIELLARKLGCAPGSVTRSRARLEALGEVEFMRKQGPAPASREGRGDRRPNLYRITGNPKHRAPVRGETSESPRTGPPFTAHKGAGSPRSSGGGTSQEPVIEEPVTSLALSPSTKRGAARKRDELFDAVTEACGIEVATITPSGRGKVNKALKELRDVGATPADVRDRAQRYRRRWPNVSLTPTALAGHWGELATDGSGLPPDANAAGYLAAKRAGR